ncbi:MAG: protein translocase subunit SecD [Arenimonas sp.]
MLEFARWKYVTIALVLLLSALYSLPNIYPKDPAVQISANRGGAVDAALVARVATVLKSHSITTKQVAIEGKNVVVRLRGNEQQSQAATVIGPELGPAYNVALNLATTVPQWLQSIYGKSMALGLDLQGGVHFLLEVDEKAAIEKRAEAFVDGIRATLRENQIQFGSVTRNGTTMLVSLRNPGDLGRAQNRIAGSSPELVLTLDPARPAVLVATIPQAEVKRITDDAIEQNMATIRNRINALGEAVVQRQGAGRIVVEIPGLQDTAEAKKMIGATATLEYRAVIGTDADAMAARDSGKTPPEARLYFRRDLDPAGRRAPILLSKRTIVTGDQLVNAGYQLDSQTGTPAVSVQLNKVGGDRMFKFTQDNVGKLMAAVYIETVLDSKIVDGKEVRTSKVNEEVISAAVIQSVFSSQFQTTGLDSPEEAKELARLLKAGALAAPMMIAEERIVGPSLGAENVQRGTQAVMYSFVFVLVFFMFYYKTFGMVTNIALLVNLLIVIAVMSAAGATMSLPGLAGIALTVGMSVDANVLINERIREELRLGNSPLASIAAGYDKAAGTIWDANVTAMLGGLAMWAFGSGPVKGFGITLVIGIVSSMYTAVEVSRGIATLIYGHRRKLTKISI